jgi:hypothetical protein
MANEVPGQIAQAGGAVMPAAAVPAAAVSSWCNGPYDATRGTNFRGCAR